MILKLILFVGIFLLTSKEAFPQEDWEVASNKEEIVVYTKDEEGSKFKAFKGVVFIETSVDKILEILRDADNYKEWYGYTKTSKLLKKEKDVQFNYVETSFPWPFKNRDMVYNMKIDATDTEKTKVSLIGLPDYIPEKKGIVRMSKAKGYILLEVVNEKTKVTYVFHSDPGKGVPAGLANHSIAELPFKTLFNLRYTAEKHDLLNTQ